MYQAPRGTVDLLPEVQRYWRYVEQHAISICNRFGYQRIDTPIFESAGLFHRAVGEATDVVQKETYTFQDRGGDDLTLRPEGTAPVCRAYIEHGMSNLPQPVRLFYFCPIFRYERPQAGRYREHHQFGIEAIGDGDPTIDAEVIQIGWTLTQELGLRDLAVVVNSIGDPSCRPGYLVALKAYYKDHLDHVCADCRSRYDRNPLRLLDCKQDGCQPYVGDAPRSSEYLCEPCQEHWTRLQHYLDILEVPYRVDHRLVRGLDYYTRTVFEIQPPGEGSQSTIVGGGRYDGLIEALGARPTPGIGFGSGIERMILNLDRQGLEVAEDSARPVVIVHRGAEGLDHGLGLATELRSAGHPALVAPTGKSMRAQMRYASATAARFTLVIGEDELANGTVSVRDMDNGTQETVQGAGLSDYLQARP